MKEGCFERIMIDFYSQILFLRKGIFAFFEKFITMRVNERGHLGTRHSLARTHARTHTNEQTYRTTFTQSGAGNTARIAYGGSYMYTYICTRYTQLYN